MVGGNAGPDGPLLYWGKMPKQDDQPEAPTNERGLTELETLAAVQLNGVKFDKEAAGYTDQGGAKPCRGCTFFVPSPDDAKIGACRVVAGTIAAGGHSDYYIAAEEQQGKGTMGKAKEFKTVSGLVLGVDEAEGIVDAIFAVMGNLDEGNDIVHPGAFTKTVVERGSKVRIVDQHQKDSILRSLGKPLELREIGRDALPAELLIKHPDAVGAEAAKIQFNLKTQNGHDAFHHLAAGDIDEWSFGYDALDFDFSKVVKDGQEVTARNLRTLKLWEISPVLWGMNPATMTASAKEAKPAPEVTENTIRIRVRAPGDFQEDSFRTIQIDEDRGIQAVIGRLEGETSTTVQAYIFDKEKWSTEDAQAWVEEHEKAGDGTGGKAINLTERIEDVRAAFNAQFNPGDDYNYWIMVVYDDHVIAQLVSGQGVTEYFVPYQPAETGYIFAPMPEWQQGEFQFIPILGKTKKEYTPSGPVQRLGDVLQGLIHKAFTILSDTWYIEGLLSRDERIMLSSLIGDSLDILSNGIPAEIAQRPVEHREWMSLPDDYEQKIGRAISKANEKRIMAAIDNIDKGLDGLRTMIEEVIGAPDSEQEPGRGDDSEKTTTKAGPGTPTSRDEYADEARERDTLLTAIELLELEVTQ